jgi:hypothetical protein
MQVVRHLAYGVCREVQDSRMESQEAKEKLPEQFLFVL